MRRLGGRVSGIDNDLDDGRKISSTRMKGALDGGNDESEHVKNRSTAYEQTNRHEGGNQLTVPMTVWKATGREKEHLRVCLCAYMRRGAGAGTCIIKRDGDGLALHLAQKKKPSPCVHTSCYIVNWLL